MDFTFTEEQQAVAEAAASVFDGMVTTARVAEIEHTDDRFDAELWADLATPTCSAWPSPRPKADRGSG